mgnify:CR=1 FL=1
MRFKPIARRNPRHGDVTPPPDADKPRYATLVLGVSLLFVSTVLSASEQTAQQWLSKMSAAMQELSYQGVFVYRRDEEMAAMKVTHIVDENGARELLETLSGEARQEIRSSAAGPGAAAVPQLERIEDFYELKLLGTDRTAGQPTKVISVTPKDAYRYGYRLWLDQASGLLLKSDLLGEDGAVLEQVMFTSVKLLSAEELAPVAPHNQSRHAPHADARSGDAGQPWQWRIADLPGGFELLESQPVAQHPGIRHVVYSDGLASVSVFVEPISGEGETFVGLSRMGAVNAFGRVQDGYQVTVVGEVPALTVKTIGESIQRKGEAR